MWSCADIMNELFVSERCNVASVVIAVSGRVSQPELSHASLTTDQTVFCRCFGRICAFTAPESHLPQPTVHEEVKKMSPSLHSWEGDTNWAIRSITGELDCFAGSLPGNDPCDLGWWCEAFFLGLSPSLFLYLTTKHRKQHFPSLLLRLDVFILVLHISWMRWE